MEQQNDTGILDDWKQELYVDPVSPGVRFTNFVVDRIVFIVFILGLSFVWTAVAYSRGESIQDSPILQDNLQGKLLDYLITQLLTIIYYTLFEGFTKGRTVGKYATGTVAIKEDGTPFTFKDAFLRSLCRVIPFEPFSAFGYRPWHDSLSKTAVVKKTW
jgi:uncharacterized RDD family membrane protein YckC